MSRRISPTLPTRRLAAQATLAGDVALVALRGELNASTAVDVLSRLHAVLDAGRRIYVFRAPDELAWRLQPAG
jgi:hypothetical protein